MISTVLCFFLMQLVSSKEDMVTIELAPEEIVESFRSMIDSQYLKSLANELAARAAKHFVKQIETNKQRSQIIDHYNETPQQRRQKLISLLQETGMKKDQLTPSLLGPEVPHAQNLDESQPYLDSGVLQRFLSVPKLQPSSQVLNLLRDPSPDGDNQDRVADLTDYEENAMKEPVKTEHMINGRHFRRILGLILL